MLTRLRIRIWLYIARFVFLTGLCVYFTSTMHRYISYALFFCMILTAISLVQEYNNYQIAKESLAEYGDKL